MKFIVPSRLKIALFFGLGLFMFLGFTIMNVGLEGWMAPPSHPSKLYLLSNAHPGLSRFVGVPVLIAYSFMAVPLFPIIYLFKQNATQVLYFAFPVYCYLLACLLARLKK